MTAATTMTPLDATKTVRRPGRSHHQEIWEATSADGQWAYARIETSGTPWIARNTTTGAEDWFGSLSAARRWTAEQTVAVTT